MRYIFFFQIKSAIETCSPLKFCWCDLLFVDTFSFLFHYLALLSFTKGLAHLVNKVNKWRYREYYCTYNFSLIFWLRVFNTCKHNYIQTIHKQNKKLSGSHSHSSGSPLYECARQVCLFVGYENAKRYKLRPSCHGYGFGYDESVNPGTLNMFTTAVFRSLHSLIPHHIE